MKSFPKRPIEPLDDGEVRFLGLAALAMMVTNSHTTRCRDVAIKALADGLTGASGYIQELAKRAKEQ